MDEMKAPAGLDDVARVALACMDLTSLGEADTPLVVADLVARSRCAVGVPAALCVWPRFVGQVAAGLRALHGSDSASSSTTMPKVAAVANFPGGAQPLSEVLRQVRGIVADGGDEVDLVLDWQALRRGGVADVEQAAMGVRAVRQACRGAVLKLIIESGELKEPALIALASRMGLNEGVDFLKTSTGKTPTGATPQAARVMMETIAAHPRAARVGFKASGGVRTVRDAKIYVDLVVDILGPQALCPARFRIGASGLLNDVEQVLALPGGKAPCPHPGAYDAGGYDHGADADGGT
ncbi:MAG: deoxyribose-phosphate aldolase [Betaproteobacteria bacterium]|nr:deoxyribose-phosphate aldolase [Betaproteobacteria bacterium]NBU49110.1 deoxyribose-phosphate aldolase [Betaproteobacteria bacterium]NBX95984.1 deoxyribose-phosphate aldolase [Betaproteobacteria bacterium]